MYIYIYLYLYMYMYSHLYTYIYLYIFIYSSMYIYITYIFRHLNVNYTISHGLCCFQPPLNYPFFVPFCFPLLGEGEEEGYGDEF